MTDFGDMQVESGGGSKPIWNQANAISAAQNLMAKSSIVSGKTSNLRSVLAKFPAMRARPQWNSQANLSPATKSFLDRALGDFAREMEPGAFDTPTRGPHVDPAQAYESLVGTFKLGRAFTTNAAVRARDAFKDKAFNAFEKLAYKFDELPESTKTLLLRYNEEADFDNWGDWSRATDIMKDDFQERAVRRVAEIVREKHPEQYDRYKEYIPDKYLPAE